MALPEEVHEFLKMTHTSSTFLKPPISLIAHHICSQLTSIVLIYLQGKQEKIIFEHLVYVFREQLRDAGKQIVKMKASSICSFLTEGTGGMRRVQEPELTPFFTLGLGPLWASNHHRRHWSHGHLLGLQPNAGIPVLHTWTAEVGGTIPSSAHHLRPCIHLSEHSQEAFLNISSGSQLQNAEQNMCKSGI